MRFDIKKFIGSSKITLVKGIAQSLEFGKANVVKKGDDLTLITYGMMVMMAVDVANQLEKEGISVEIIDLRTIVPFDAETVSASVQKTGKVLILHEAQKNVGFGAEIATQIVEKDFTYLDAPVVRVCGKDAPVPYSKDLEDAVLPQKQDLEKSIRDLASY